MKKQQAKQSDLLIGTTQRKLTPVQTEPLWNGCGKPTAIHDCVIIKHRARQAVTAMHTLSHQLRLFSWRVNADGDVVCTGATEGQGEDVVQIDLVRIDPLHAVRYVTAYRTGSGELYLQCWDVSNTGAFYPSGPALRAAEGLAWVQLLALGQERFLTIGLGGDGLWYLTTWQISAIGELEEQQQSTMPATTGALAAGLLPIQDTGIDGSLFVTAIHIAPATVRWTIWSALPAGDLVPMQTVEEQHTDIIDLAVTTANNQLVTLLHQADGQLQLTTHALPRPHAMPVEHVDIVTPEYRSTSTLATDVRYFAVSHYEDQLLIAYITCAQQDQMMKLCCWSAGTAEPPPDPAAAIDCGTLPVQDTHTLALCDQPLEGYAPMLTAVGTVGGGLQLTTWSIG